MKKVLLLTTGGTIAAREGGYGLKPVLSGEELLRFIADFKALYDITVKDILHMDSSNIQAEEWHIIARTVIENLKSYDGVVITHGTDTMAYTASMLCFMLKNLSKPVVLTGAQMPIYHPLTDARNNLYTAFAAVDNEITGVSVAFHYKIINGCRAVKVRTMGFEAFESINAPYLGEMFANGMHKSKRTDCVNYNGAPTELCDKICPAVFLLKLIPGTDPEIFDMLLKMKYRGVVLETFGAGGINITHGHFLSKIKMLVDNGVAVAAVSQCTYEPSDFSIYEVGTQLMSCGVIPGMDMTTEAVVTKLMWALGQTESLDEVRRIFNTCYAGEVTLSCR